MIVAACYGSAALLALLALWYFGVKKFYWHALSIVAAFAIGLVHLPEEFTSPNYTLVIGWLFVFLFLWGVAAPVVAVLRHPPQFHLHHHR
jgi:hypothetical protein